jgi:RNA polymerase sigma-70 factor (ECF subfamily)
LDEFQTEVVGLLPRLRRFARSLCRNSADADDLVQLSIERALNREEQWQPGTRLDSWIFRIMKNAWIDEMRTRTRQGRNSASPDVVEEIVDESIADLEVRREARAVLQAMEVLPEDQRLAVSLVLIDGLSYREASEILDIPMGTLTSRLVRGRQALLADLGAAP